MTNSSFRVTSSLILLLIVALGSEFSPLRAAASDDKQILMEKVEMDWIKPEKLGSSRGASPTARDNKWILVEFAYTISPDPSAKEKVNFLDEVTFKVSVEGREGEGDERTAKTAILTGEVTYMAVPIGKGYGALYISPDVAAYYRIDKYMSKFNVNVQALIGGQVVDFKDKRKDDENWYTRADYKIVPGMLLNKQQSVFILNDTDRYPTIKPKQGN